MQKLLWKLFPPYEVKLTLQEIRAFLSRHETMYSSIVLRDAISLARDAEKTIYSVRIDHIKPDHLALLIIRNVTFKHITMGWHHAYRGMLGISGISIQTLWINAGIELIENGFASPEQINNENDMARMHIKQMG